jgi:uncharacterized protein YdaU (DUF1376 family)
MAKKDYQFTDQELAEFAIENKDFNSPQFQLYVNDFLGSNRVLMLEPTGVSAYFFLLLASWNEKDCGLPSDDKSLLKLSRLYPNDWEMVKECVLTFFFEYKGRLYNRRLLLERKKQINGRNQRIDALRKRYETSTEEPTEEPTEDNTGELFPDNDNDNDNDNDINTDKRLMKKEAEKKESERLEKGFRDFWNAYPLKVGKKKARESFIKIKPDVLLIGTMLGAIEMQKQSEKWSDKKYIPHPTTWLNQARWEDEIIPQSNGHPKEFTYREMQELINQKKYPDTDSFTMIGKDKWVIKTENQ